ncbi:MAG: RIP metalloprotease RseP [Ignavibacterium sp.]|nr:MAG: RIP metalloprotease RseP [Ignavibacterium sp.]
MDYIIFFALTIGILVFIHEFGHFAAAKLSGMRVDVFAIGFGRRLFGWNKKTGFTFGDLDKDFDGEGNTDYRISMLPLGGYVKIAGMVDESFDTKFASTEAQPYEFRSKPMWQKIFVITAGVFMNFMLAWIIFWGGNFFEERAVFNTTTIGIVVTGSAANSAGFETNDKILAVNGENVSDWEDLVAKLFINSLGEDVNVLIERNGVAKTLLVTRSNIPDYETQGDFLLPEGTVTSIGEVLEDAPAMTAGLQAGDIFLSIKNIPVLSRHQVTKIIKSNPQTEIPITVVRDVDTLTMAVTPGKDGMIGISIATQFKGDVKYTSYGFFESIYKGLTDIVKYTDLTFNMLGKVFTGKVEFGKAFGGPVKIAQYAAKTADIGISSFLYFLALLSLSLAIINIMPFPVLDGGHLLIIIIEGIAKREIPIRIKIAIQNTGLVILLLLMAFIIYNDILSL